MTTQAVRRIFIFGIFGILVGLSKGLPKDGPSKVLLLTRDIPGECSADAQVNFYIWIFRQLATHQLQMKVWI